MIKAILSFKEAAARAGLGKERWLAETALPVLGYPAFLEKRRNSLSCPSPLLVFSVYSHFWRLLKGSRSQGVKKLE